MKKETAIFAGGCFWCMVKPFDEQSGIISVVSGYCGGHVENPTYEQVCTETTGHAESVEITYDADVVSYKELVELYWKIADPTDAMGQFQDRGESYRPVIFYNSNEQKEIAEASKQELAASGIFDKPIVTEIQEATPFYPAEDYHQDFYKKDPLRFMMQESGGRGEYIKKHLK